MSAQDLPFLDSPGGLTTDELLGLEGQYRTDSIVLAFESALLRKPFHTEAERVVLAVEAVEREVNNGGFNQFFFNSSREYAYFAPTAFERIGAPATADLCMKALTLVSDGRELGETELQQRATDMDEESQERLFALDSLYYRSVEEPLADRLLEYIKLNRHDISTSAP